MTTDSTLSGPYEWDNTLVGLYVWDSLGGTLFRITDADMDSPQVWYEFVDQTTLEPLRENGDMDGIEFMELCKDGSYTIYHPDAVRK
jgi:hypothetical protein